MKATLEDFAEFTRSVAEAHTEWDSPHQFMSLHSTGSGIEPRTLAILDPGIHPTMYPGVMTELAARDLRGDTSEPVCGYLLSFEAYCVVAPKPDASEAVQRQFHADRANRTFHTRSDAEEVLYTMCADLAGNLWTVIKRRSEPGYLAKEHHPPGERQPQGQFAAALLSIAHAARQG